MLQARMRPARFPAQGAFCQKKLPPVAASCLNDNMYHTTFEISMINEIKIGFFIKDTPDPEPGKEMLFGKGKDMKKIPAFPKIVLTCRLEWNILKSTDLCGHKGGK
ncbi:MAG TPA: hypothetical protein H9700_12985 [Candidatus Eisenbergiella intestinipullorum]|nr:hypothetical protein [Candidatus Eisenbergiella intestinipullorum]